MGFTTFAARRRAGWIVAVALIAAAAWVAVPQFAAAHDSRDVGPYRFVVGFMVEPAFEGIPNGIDLRITEDDEPVEGVEETLQAEVTHVDSNVSREMPLRALFGQPGHYTADFVPTAPGRYLFHFTGSINGVEIDEEFEGGEGRFSDIEPIGDVQFPEAIATGRELQGAATGARDLALDAEERADRAQTLAIVGIGVGVLGLIAGGAGVAAGMRRRA